MTKSVTRHEFSLMMLIDKAVAGDFEAAETVLRMWEYAERHGGGGLVVKIHDWWPDADGQTVHEKSKAVGKGMGSPDLPTEPEES